MIAVSPVVTGKPRIDALESAGMLPALSFKKTLETKKTRR
jgi:hypothetical protein